MTEIIENEDIQEIEVTQEVEDSSVNSEVEVSDSRKWFILQTYSGQEYKVRERINTLIEDNIFQGKVARVLIPEEETIEIKDNKRFEKVAKIYPGYVFVEMEEDDTAWFQLRKITGVAKVVGSKSKPVPVSEKEILKILQKIGEKTKKIEVDFEKEEVIKVIAGPFRGYTGTIEEIYPEKGKLKALISIFGRETPVELDFLQVTKL